MLVVFIATYRSYLDKHISLHLNKGRKVSGTLRGYDQFMNLVLGDATEELGGDDANPIGMVVSTLSINIVWKFHKIDSCCNMFDFQNNPALLRIGYSR